MVIVLNDNEIPCTLEHEETIGDVLGALEAECKKAQETIVSIKADGKTLDAGELDSLFALPATSNTTIELTTVSGEAVRQYMKELAQALLNCAHDFEQIPIYMQTGEDAKVLDLLQYFSEQLNELYRSFLLYDITGIPLDSLIENKPLSEYQKEITHFLQEITTSIAEKDIIQTGDLAEYELSPLVKSFITGVLLLIN
ncbi:MAG: hypothetical protein ACTTJ7_00115 [Treponema sp.]